MLIGNFVIGTGKTYRVRDFVELAFAEVGLDPANYVVIDPSFYRPAEVDLLLADPSKAERQLGWKPRTDLQQLVKMMVANDLQLASRELALQAKPALRIAA